MKTKKTTVALFGNTFQIKKNRCVVDVIRLLRLSHINICIEQKFADFIVAAHHLDLSDCSIISTQGDFTADVAFSMGGDGTFLGTAARIGRKGIPILGINTGHLGFLADVSPDGISEAIDSVLSGKYIIEQRSLIHVTKDGKPLTTYPYALNEIAVLKHDNSSLIEIRTHIDGNHLTNYQADGLIVCTPTGSTGYSLSTGGPIIVPQSGTFCLSAVAPHSLNIRPVILCDNVDITLEVYSRSHNFLISIDGRSESFPDGTAISLRKADYTIGVIKIKHKHFFDTLKEKMMWGIDPRY